MTPLFACSFAAGITDWSMALPRTLGGKDKSFFGRRSTPVEILVTWALLKGTKIATVRTKAISATGIHLVRFFMSGLLPVVNSDNTPAVGRRLFVQKGTGQGNFGPPSKNLLMKRGEQPSPSLGP